MREIIDRTQRVTENNRKLFEGKCIECSGNLALMSGYATLPDSLFSSIGNSDGEYNDSEE